MNIFEKVERIALRGIILPAPINGVALSKDAKPEICEYVKPDYIYLGSDEYDELMQDHRIFSRLQPTPNGLGKLAGVVIIQVMERSHFSYGWKI